MSKGPLGQILTPFPQVFHLFRIILLKSASLYESMGQWFSKIAHLGTNKNTGSLSTVTVDSV